METALHERLAAPSFHAAPDLPVEVKPGVAGSQGPFCAVAAGRDGHQGICRTWGECSVWTAGVPGNVSQRFSTLEGAKAFIGQHNMGKSDQGGGP